MSRKRFWFIVGGIVCLLAGAAAAVRYSIYKNGQPALLSRQAEEAANHNDFESASLLARRALEINPDCIPACNVMAEICEKAGVSDALKWRKHAADLAGNTAAALLAYASAAVNFGEDELARGALGRISEADRQSVDYQAVAGALALNAGRYSEAEHFFAQAVRLEPNNSAHRFSLAKAQANSDDYFVRETGRRALASMAEQSGLRLSARRALVLSYEGTQEIGSAADESRKLAETPGHTFADKLLHLRYLHMIDDEEFPSALAAAENIAQKNEKDAALLLHWMSLEGEAAEAVKWSTTRSPAVSEMPAVKPWLAHCYSELGDWPALLSITRQGPWQPIEHMRHAYRARALREEDELIPARSEWKMAVAAATDADAISWLVKTAGEWKMTDEKEEVLWAAADNSQLATGALASLYRHYDSQNDTDGLRKVSARLIEVDPKNEDARNNFAMFSLLRNRDVGHASEIAQSLYQKHPDNPVYVSTYSFALYCGGRSDEALRVLETLPPSQLETPAVAMYYGIILAANHLPEKAGRFLGIVRDVPMLAEERDLIDKSIAIVENDAPKAK